MKKKLLKIISTISLVFVMMLSPVLVQCVTSKRDSNNLTMQTRTIAATSQMLDVESIFNEYEDGELKIDGTLTTFEGTKRFTLADFEELDLVSDSDIEDEEIQVRYHYGYDYETNIVTLTAILIMEDDIPLTDTLEGYAFINEQGNIDAEFDMDGETMLLSELQELGMIENCGWFKNLCKSVTKAVTKAVTKVATTVATTVKNTAKATVSTVKTAAKKTAESVKKATSTTLGAVITGVGAAACVAVGVIGAVVAAPAIAVVAVGAVVGATALATATAVSTKKTEGQVDWDAVKQSAVVGAALGGAISGVSYAATGAIQSAVAKSAASSVSGSAKVANGTGYNSFDAFKKANGAAGKDHAWHHIVEQNSTNISKFGNQAIHNTGNLVKIPSGYQGSLHSKLTALYNSKSFEITGNTTQTVRQWLSTQSFDAQYKFGVEKLLEFAKELGVKVVLP